MRKVRGGKYSISGSAVRGALASWLFVSATILGLLSTNRAQVQTCTPPPPNMVSWWPGDENANDIQGTDNGALQGGATFASGKVAQGFSLNGTSAYISIPDSRNLYPSGSFTVDAWVKTSKSTGVEGIITHYECGNSCVGGSNSVYELDVSNGNLSGYIRDTSGANQSLIGTSMVADGSFHHVALQRDIAA